MRSSAIQDSAASVQEFLSLRGHSGAILSGRLLDTPASGRSVHEYALVNEKVSGVSPSVIAKCFPDASGAQVFATMRALSAAIAAQACRTLVVPEALHYDSARSCLVQERVRGLPLSEALNEAPGVEVRHALLRLVGKALAELHGLDARALGARTPKKLDDHVGELMRPHPLAVGLAIPGREERIRGLTERLVKAGASIEPAMPVAPLHRDFHFKQLFVDGTRIALIDWDLFGAGDPALDVANFLMHIELRCGPESESAQAAFLEAYLAARPEEILARVPVYRAFNHLRRVCKSFRLQADGWLLNIDENLERVAHWLDLCQGGKRSGS